MAQVMKEVENNGKLSSTNKGHCLEVLQCFLIESHIGDSSCVAGTTPERPRNLKKRKLPGAPPLPEEAEPKDPYIALLETTSKTLHAAFTESMQAQIKMYSRTVHAQLEAQKQENELERALRKEQGDKLIGVLTTLVDTLSKIAEKL